MLALRRSLRLWLVGKGFAVTLSQFRMHRRPLYLGFLRLVEDTGVGKVAVDPDDPDVDQTGWTVTPVYQDDCRFVAEHPAWEAAICVGPRHPKFLETDGGSGCVGSWWWVTDLFEEE